MFRRSRLLVALAMLLSVAVMAPAARADWTDNVRWVADRMLNNCGLLISDAECLALTQDPNRLIGGEGVATPARAVSPAALGALRGLWDGAARTLSTKCLQQNSCLSLGLGSLLAALGIWQFKDDALNLFDRENPDFEPANIANYPQGGYFTAATGSNLWVDINPVSVSISGNTVTVTTDINVTQTAGGWDVGVLDMGQAIQCRSADGVYSVVHGSSPGGTMGVGPRTVTTEHTMAHCGSGGTVNYVHIWGGGGGGLTLNPNRWFTWGAEGAVLDGSRPEGEDTGTARITCRDDLGSEYTVTTEAVAGSWDVPVPRCLTGDIPTGLEVGPRAPGGGIMPETTYDLSPETLAPNLDTYPACGDSSCLYHVRVNGVPCQVGMAGCVQWTRNPSAQCYYGPYEVDLRLCGVMERYYEIGAPMVPATSPGAGVGDSPNTDGDPTTSDGPTPEPEFPGTPTGPGTGTGTSGPVPAACIAPSYPNHTKITANAARLLEEVGTMFDVPSASISTYRSSDPYPDHPSGRAVDLGTDEYPTMTKGQAMANYIQQNAVRLGVDYMIWNQQRWKMEKADEGWVDMADRGSVSQNHKDHVHVTVYDNGSVDCSAGVGGSVSDQCFPNGWTWNPVNWVLEPVKCALRWAFVPDPVKVDVSIAKIRTAWMTHPPGSIVTAITPTVTSVGAGIASGDCSDLPAFTPPAAGAASVSLPCEPAPGQPWDTIYLVTQSGIVVLAVIYLWGMVAAGVSARSTGA